MDEVSRPFQFSQNHSSHFQYFSIWNSKLTLCFIFPFSHPFVLLSTTSHILCVSGLHVVWCPSWSSNPSVLSSAVCNSPFNQPTKFFISEDFIFFSCNSICFLFKSSWTFLMVSYSHPNFFLYVLPTHLFYIQNQYSNVLTALGT